MKFREILGEPGSSKGFEEAQLDALLGLAQRRFTPPGRKSSRKGNQQRLFISFWKGGFH